MFLLKQLLLISFCFIFASCNLNKSQNKVCAVLKTENNSFYKELTASLKLRAKGLGIGLDIFYVQDEKSWQEQLALLEKYKNLYSGFILSPNDSSKFSNIIKWFKDHNKPIVSISDLEDTPTSIIKTNSIRGGELAALYARKLNNKRTPGCAVIITGNLKAKEHNERRDGFKTKLFTMYPNLKVFNYEGYSDRQLARKIVLDNIKLIGSCPIFYATNDMMILGVYDALKNHNLNNHKILIGFDGTTIVQKEILEGNISASVKQDTFLMGKMAIDTIQKYLEKQNVPQEQLVEPKLVVRSHKIDLISYEELISLPDNFHQD